MKSLSQKDICTPMFNVALFTIAKTWKPPQHPSVDEWIKKMWYRYTVEHYLAMKKKDILLNEVSQTEKDKYYMISLICGI